MEDKGICYSTNGEDFSYTEIEDATEQALEDISLVEGSLFSIWKADYSRPLASRFAPDMAEFMNERAGDDFGEYAESWPDASPEATKELDGAIADLIDKWAEKHKAQPNFYAVSNSAELKFVITKTADYSGDVEYESVVERKGK